MKKFSLILLCLCCLFTLTSCKDDGLSLSEKVAAGEVVNVGIVQYVTAPPLDSARIGIVNALKEAGFIDGEKIKITVYNPQTDQSSLAQMAKTAIADNDIVFAIATPVAQVLAGEIDKQGSDIPILFTAVTDPVAAHIIDNATTPGINISGTSDMNPVAEQVAFFNELCPSGSKLGFIYTSSEDNSVIQLNLANTKAESMGITLQSQAINSVNDLATAVNSLISSGIDALYLPTDNIVSANISVVVNLTNESGIPTICGESSFVNAGGTLTLGINYEKLGELTGEMAVELFNGTKDIENMAVETLSDWELIINTTVAEANGITISNALKDRADEIK